MSVYKPESENGRPSCYTAGAVRDAMLNSKILSSRVILCDSEHNLHVDLGCMRGIIPREDCAEGIREGTARDIAIISRVNKIVCFKVVDIIDDSENGRYALLSRRLAQDECREKYINNLSPGDVIGAKVTHLEPFGAFCDIGCGISALLPIDGISVSRIPHPDVRLRVNQNIKTVVKSIDSDGRVLLSHKELLGTWIENASLFSVGETVPGIIRSVEDYGIFVELTPNFAGLAEKTPGVKEGKHAGVFIKSIIPEKMKVKLIIVDSFSGENINTDTRYFFEGEHMDSFTYSPPGAYKLIQTIFK